MLHWHIGQRIRKDILQQARAEYGERIVETLAQQSSREFGRGFARRNLFNMIRFAEVFAEAPIVQTLSAQLGWSHFLELQQRLLQTALQHGKEQIALQSAATDEAEAGEQDLPKAVAAKRDKDATAEEIKENGF